MWRLSSWIGRSASRRACRSASGSDRRRCGFLRALPFPPFELVAAAFRQQGRDSDHEKAAGDEHADEEFGIAETGRDERIEKSLHGLQPPCRLFGRTALNGRESVR